MYAFVLVQRLLRTVEIKFFRLVSRKCLFVIFILGIGQSLLQPRHGEKIEQGRAMPWMASASVCRVKYKRNITNTYLALYCTSTSRRSTMLAAAPIGCQLPPLAYTLIRNALLHSDMCSVDAETKTKKQKLMGSATLKHGDGKSVHEG
jgi:hypothetical protein